MTSPRRTAIGLLALISALAAITAPAGATQHGIGGYVTDADTGLGLAGATATWLGDLTPPPSITTAAGGRYLFAGLTPGSTGSVAVTGPTGYESTTVANVQVPAEGNGSVDPAVHRDWSSTAGGATFSANDDAGPVASCGAAAALDLNATGTAWSASASRPAADPPALTVQLPSAIDISQFVVTPASGCSDPAGSALSHFRVDTSADGTTWAPALETTLGADAVGKPTALSPTANASGVRYVRLVLLGAQDPAAAKIDVGELEVFGSGPNDAPVGDAVSVDQARVYLNSTVNLKSSFTDGDDAIVHYLWDFDGDGVWDQVTDGPEVAHVWAGAGMYHVIAGARDFRGALGTTSLDLRVIDPNVPVEPVIQRKPLVTFGIPDGPDLPARIACSSRCTFTVDLFASRRMARRLHLKHTRVLHFRKRSEALGIASWDIYLPNSLIHKLRTAGVRSFTARVVATAVDQQGRKTTVHRSITFS